MKTAAERINFAVRFAGLDLEDFRPGDWMNLREDLEKFLAPGGGALKDQGGFLALPMVPPLPKEMTEQALRELQDEIRSLLGGLADAPARPGAGPVARFVDSFPISVSYAVLPLPALRASIMQASGATRDVALLTLIHLLVRADVSPIRRCPEDDRLFYRVRRQKYCSRTCVNRVNKRDQRTKSKGGT